MTRMFNAFIAASGWFVWFVMLGSWIFGIIPATMLGVAFCYICVVAYINFILGIIIDQVKEAINDR